MKLNVKKGKKYNNIQKGKLRLDVFASYMEISSTGIGYLKTD